MEHVKHYVFVVDTDSYAGNFERPLVAYISGHVGDCGVGDTEAEIATQELSSEVADWLDNNVTCVNDDGCSRPAAIWPTPGWFNDGLGDHFKDDHDWAGVVRRYNDKVTRGSYSDDHKADLIERGPGRYPACQSVAMYLLEAPPANVFAVLCERALKYAAGYCGHEPTVTGFRVLKITENEIDVTPAM